MLNRNSMLLLTVMGGAVIAAVLAFQRNARQAEIFQHKLDLQRWENEVGSNAPSEVVKQPS